MTEVCANCAAPLSGPYCARCGQHAHASSRSVTTFLRDALHELANSDGRLWRTLAPLLLSPGRLTNEYFAGRRTQYLPPFRLYLIVSLVFFGISGGGIVTPPQTADTLAKPGTKATFTVADCEKARIDIFGDPRIEAAVREGCARIAEHGLAETLRAFTAYIPRMMFVFLPLMAAVMVPLYWWPRRYYVEHLVFFLHDHAALFLAYTLLAVLRPISRHVGALSWLESVAAAGLAIYAVWYVWTSMRRHYGQGRGLTLVKFVVISFAYGVALLVTLAGTAILTVLSG